VGWVAAFLVLATTAGNIGTNHLFEPTLLDRLVALALGWVALGEIAHSRSQSAKNGWRAAMVGILLGLAAWVHPSMGLQLASVVAGTYGIGIAWPGRLGWNRREAVMGLVWVAVGQIPSFVRMMGQAGTLFEGLPVEEFRPLALYVQGPQHLVPHLWRQPQWLAWGCFPILAWLGLGEGPWGPSRRRVAALLAVVLVGLGIAAVGIEVVSDLRLTLFQPFRMATLARGLCLVLAADRVRRLALRGDFEGRLRAAVLVVGLTGDWAIVVATAFELVAGAADRWIVATRARRWIVLGALGVGISFLARHDTEGRHVAMLAALGAVALASMVARGRSFPLTRGRLARWTLAAWAVPLLAAVAAVVPIEGSKSLGRAAGAIAEHCRFGETPADDLERLAVWCREHTPADARFVGPPGAKTFRLWSRRALAFNRAASPYHAAGLADWADRFRDHVGFAGTSAELAAAYLADRRGLEQGYDRMSAAERSELARRQGASYLVAAGADDGDPSGPLVLLHREGRYGVYAVPERLAGLTERRSPGTSRAGRSGSSATPRSAR
jgi:hypothetical protein